MRRQSGHLLFAGLILLTGCAEVLNYVYLSGERYPPRGENEQIEFVTLPAGARSLEDADLEQPYEVLARFDMKQQMGEGNLAQKAMDEARKIGGDAVVFQPTGAAGDDTNATATVWVVRYERE
jgi:hypothetical protein